MKIQAKLLLGFGSVIMLLVLYSGFNMGVLSNIGKQTSFVHHNSIEAIKGSLRIQIAVYQVQQWLTDVSATRGLNGLDDGFKEAEEWSGNFHQEVDALKKLYGNSSKEAKELDEITASFNAYYEMGKKMAHSYVEGGPETGNVLMGEFDGFAADINSRVDAMVRKNSSLLSETMQSLQDEISNGSERSIIFTLLALFMGIIAALVISKRISAQMKSVSDIMRKIARGDLTYKEVTVDSNDEIGELCQSVNLMGRNLKTILGRVFIASRKCDSISRILSRFSEELAKGVNEQMDKAALIASATHQMQSSIEDIAHGTSNVTQLAKEANDTVQEGTVDVEHNIQSMNSILRISKETSEIVAQLGVRSKEIGKVISVIEEIAEQTNLLALNAAIEAARAGEHGRGFAVVADEVRKLSDRTAGATKEIDKTISIIQKETNHALETMDTAVKTVEEGATFSRNVEVSLKEVTKQVEKFNAQIIQTAAATEEQSVTSGQISRDMESIVSVTQNSGKNVGKISGISINIDMLASELHDVVMMFQLTEKISAEENETDGNNIQWSEFLSTGLDWQDEQHKALIHEINNLLSALNDGKGTEEIGKVMNFLENYVVKHFGQEEKEMQQCHYPDYSSHKQCHTDFISTFLDLKRALQSEGFNNQILSRIQKTLCKWLIEHIAHVDKKMAEFVKAAKAKE